jgi:hypothetical protein
MNFHDTVQSRAVAVLTLTSFLAVTLGTAFAQGPFPPRQLDGLVSRIALYPDPLLAQVLTASTFPDQIPDAARWADQHAYIHGDDLSRAIAEDNLPWDPSILGLLAFPSVLDMMARDPGWTSQLGNAVLSQRADVMDAVQRMRQQAQRYGYLRSGPQYNVVYDGPLVEIVPVNPAFVYVPVYNPAIVFAAPRPGLFVGGAITFGVGIGLGVAFARTYWAGPRFDWRAHNVIINRTVWNRTVVNRNTYVHEYAAPRPRPNVERREIHESRPHAPERREERREERR